MTNISTIASGRGPYEQTVTVLGASAATGMAVTGTASKTTLATVVVPGGSLGRNGILRVTSLWTHTNSANNKTLNIDFGGTAFLQNIATATSVTQNFVMIRNRNSASSQVGFMATTFQSFVTAAASAVSSSVDTTTAQNLTFAGTLGNTGETITLESYLVELIRAD